MEFLNTLTTGTAFPRVPPRNDAVHSNSLHVLCPLQKGQLMRDVKMTDQTAGCEKADREIARNEIAGHEITGHENGKRTSF